MNMEAFRKWLLKNKGLTTRSAKDVISRINRVSNFEKIEQEKDTLIKKLNKNQEFRNLTVTVQSQIRRAIRLLKEFEKNLPT